MKNLFPDKIPVFPLNGVIYFPKTSLPLNIFEKRYLELVNDCIKTNKLLGVIQSKKNNVDLYKVGCLGKISEFQRNEDGRIIINLTGLTRFEIKKEIDNTKLYREFSVQYEKFNYDTQIKKQIIGSQWDQKNLFTKIKTFFKKYNLFLNWQELDKLGYDQQINTLSMIAPISNEEKQSLLETVTIDEKAKTLNKIIEFYLHGKSSEQNTIQ
jgi:Lon protease-like protein